MQPYRLKFRLSTRSPATTFRARMAIRRRVQSAKRDSLPTHLVTAGANGGGSRPEERFIMHLNMHRRQFLSTSAAIGAGVFVSSLPGRLPGFESGPRKRIAFLATVCFTHSHTQHFLDRLTEGYIWQGKWQAPRVELASVYIDQFPDGDLAKAASRSTNCGNAIRFAKP